MNILYYTGCIGQALNNIFTKNCLLVLFLFLQFQISVAQVTPAELGIIPIPKILTEVENHFNLTASSNIVYTNPVLQPLANILQEDLAKITGLSLAVTLGTSSNGDIELGLNNSLPNEGYTLNVNSKIIITGKDYRATVWGISTLIQSINNDGSIKEIGVSDSPDTDYRGLMIDLARQWHTIEEIENVINLCRLYKIKYLHLHLTDSDSFTFPSTAYPLLATPGRSYTLAELHGLEAYSQARGVTIIPELEVPGHSIKMIQAYPNFFGSATNGIINITRADVRAGVGTIISEIADVFQATPYFHMGCDEVNFNETNGHPDYVNAIAAEGVGDIHGLFNFFINEMNDYVKAEGKSTLIWEGFDSGKTGVAKVDADVIVCPFDNYTNADVYALNGHDILNTSWYPLYLVPATYVPEEKIYDWDVTQFGRYASAFPFSHNNTYEYNMTLTNKIIGAQTCSWEQKGEHEIATLRSRLSPMSERVWNANAGRTYANYQSRFAKSDQVLTAILANTVPEAITPSASYQIFPNKIDIRWRAEGQFPTSYTLYRSTSNNSATAVPILSNTTLTYYEDTNVMNGQTYYYWIKSQNSIGTSAFGNSADGRTGSLTLVDLYEPFDYTTNGGLNGLNGGAGFSSGWNITMNNGTAQIVSSSLDYPNLITNGNSLNVDMMGGSGSFLAERQLAGSLSPEGSEVWVSFLIKANKAANGHFFVNIGSKNIGKKWGNGIYFGSTNAQLELVNGETNLIVLKIESFNGNDNVHIWTNPLVNGIPPSLNDPNRYFTDREDVGTNPRIQLNSQHYGEGSYVVDEFRIGDTFDDVLPVSNIIVSGACPEEAMDNFSYTSNTNINGANGGLGFNNAWSVPNAMNGSIEVLAGSLNFPGANSTGNKLRFTLQNENTSKWITRDLSNSFQNGDEVWMSCLIQPIVRADGGFWIKPNGRQDIAIGKRWGTQFAIDNNGSSTNAQANAVYKLVVRYKLEANQTVAHLWINKNDNFTDANADVTKTVNAISSINNVQIDMELWGDGIVEIDELTFGCTAPLVCTGLLCDDDDITDNTCSDVCVIGAHDTTTIKPQKEDLVLGEKKILFIRGQDAAFPYNATDEQIQVFQDSSKTYLSRISHGKMSVANFDITPIYNIDVSKPFYQRGDDLLAIAAQSYNIADYDVYVFCDKGDLAGAGGLGTNNGAKGRLYLNTNLLWYYRGDIHELIHAFGPGHAENIEGGNVMWPGNSTGGADPYYFMGSEGAAGLQADIPAWMKYWLGWLDADNIITQSTKPSCSSVHRIYKHAYQATIPTGRKVAIQLGEELMISYEPDNYNDKVTKTGVLLHNVPPQSPAVTRLLDTSPGSSSLPDPLDDLYDAAMVTGEQVNWQGTNITVLAEGGTGKNKWVDIEICDCITVSGDTDNDGFCNELDACEGFDDNIDTDFDGIPDDCDTCPLSYTNDLNNDAVCDNEQCVQVAAENFNYTANSTIATANGGTGFGNAWSIPNTMNGSIEVQPGSLNYPSIISAGNKLRFSLNNEDATKWISRNLAYPFQTGDEVWISLLIKPIVRADGGFWIMPNGRQEIAIGKRWGSQLAIDNNGSNVNVVANKVYKLDVRYKLESNQTVAHLWIDRYQDFTDTNADAAKTIGAIAEISSLEISMERWGNGVVEIDELSIGCENLLNICSDVIVDINTPDILYGKSANISISTNGKVPGGTNVQYHAGQEIELLNSFEVELDAEFEAYIAPCN